MRVNSAVRPPAPVQGTAFANTEARVEVDVITYEQNEEKWVKPVVFKDGSEQPQGISVVTGNACNLPANNRPKGAPWNGSASSTMGVWSISSNNLGTDLQYVSAPIKDAPEHGVISPRQAMPLSQYQTALRGIQWVAVPAPTQSCESGDVVASNRLELDVMALMEASPPDSSALDSVVLAANRSGIPKTAILHTLTVIGQRFDESGQEERANHIWNLYDRIIGFCGPHARLDLQ